MNQLQVFQKSTDLIVIPDDKKFDPIPGAPEENSIRQAGTDLPDVVSEPFKSQADGTLSLRKEAVQLFEGLDDSILSIGMQGAK